MSFGLKFSVDKIFPTPFNFLFFLAEILFFFWLK